MRLGKYRFDQIKVPSSAESFAKGFYAGNIKPDDLTEFSFHRYDGNLLVGKLSETDARDYMLAFPVGSIRGFPNDLNFYLCAQLKELGSRALLENNVLLPNWGTATTQHIRIKVVGDSKLTLVCWRLGISAKSLKPKTK